MDTVNKFNIVFESPKIWHKWFIEYYLNRGFKIWLIEPFYAYHHEKGIRFFPQPLPKYIDDMIKNGKINLLTAKELGAREIYSMAADKAVEVIEKVYPEYQKQHHRLIKFVCDALRSSVAENIFKKQLCDQLAVFYSTNIVLNSIEKVFSQNPTIVYPEMNVFRYKYLQKLFVKIGQKVPAHTNVIFSQAAHIAGFCDFIKDNFMVTARLFVQMMASVFFLHRIPCRSSGQKKKSYKYGVTIISPTRQLVSNQKGPDFIVDNKKVHDSDVVYFPLAILNEDQIKRLHELKGDILYPVSKWQNFSHFSKWIRLLWVFFKDEYLKSTAPISEAHRALAEYFKWQRVMTQVKIKHFITHSDFGVFHIARNIALKQSMVQTWYFLDTINCGFNSRRNENDNSRRHPLWTYLYYDHFVSWGKSIAEYFISHPGSFMEYHVVGCLCTEHINSFMKNERREFNGKFVVASYDSTYTRNSSTSHEEGIVFAQHLLRLTDECPDIVIILKEKKKRSTLIKRDPVLGPKLLTLYDEMAKKPNIKIYKEDNDASIFMSISDMIISFPFTSTTFEALSINKPAIWHDPLGYYRNTLYGKIGEVTTHSYDELKAKVLEIKSMQPNTYRNPIPIDSPLMDPYRDGKAIERFRDLLIQAQ